MRHLTRTGLAALAVALLALVAGCGGDDSGQVEAAGSATTVDTGGESPGNTGSGGTVSDTTVSSDDEDTVQWARIDPTDDLVNPTVATPDEIIVDPDDDQTVLVHFYGGVQDCYGARATVVSQDDQEVRIRLETGGQPDSQGQTCIEVAEAQELAVHLDAPVGARDLVAAAA